jgi:Uma2 family endonuclease
MAMPDTARRYTAAEVMAFPEDGNRYEVVWGELLVSPAPRPRHEILLDELRQIVRDYLRESGRSERVFAGKADITLDELTLVEPDLFVVPGEEVTNDWTTYRTLLLAVEVLSRSSVRADRFVKRRRYQAAGIPTYWVMDHENGVVEVWHPGDETPNVESETLAWRVAPDAPELTIDLRALFAGLPR